ncbi:hypothetical protein [Amycolatopsis echigonensis]|uniref:hypothetical protein n=1 Tax=Amycolatopsis echigonensis TaxID=2576905 RepID=UPI001FCA00C1|nr:hypothetical protein [Amycolatopsis niigatensis]
MSSRSPPATVSRTRTGTAAASSSAAGSPDVPAHIATEPTSHVQVTSIANGCTASGASTAISRFSASPAPRPAASTRRVRRAGRPPERSSHQRNAAFAATPTAAAGSTGKNPALPLAAANPMNTLANAAIR